MNQRDVDKWRHPMRNPNTLVLNRITNLVAGAADLEILRAGAPTRSMADQIRAGIFAALECALANGLIRLVPEEEWPDYIAMDPPYTGVRDEPV